DQNFAATHKKTPRAGDYARRVRILHDHGIVVNGGFVLEENRLECATFHILTPYPGTPLFRQLEGEGRILHRDWDRYDTAHVVFRPRHITPEQLTEGYDWCY